MTVAAPGVLANDSDPDDGALQVVTEYSSFQGFGRIDFNPDGSFTFTPAPNATGTEPLPYSIANAEENGAGDFISILVTPVKTFPPPWMTPRRPTRTRRWRYRCSATTALSTAIR